MDKRAKEILLEFVSLIFFSGFITYLFWFFKPNDLIRACVIIPIIVILLVIMYSMCKYIIILQNKLKECRFQLPKVLTIDKDIIILEKSELYSINAHVSIYYTNDKTGSKIIAHGYVETILDRTENVQVKIISTNESNNNYLNNRYRQNIVVKPFDVIDITQIKENR